MKPKKPNIVERLAARKVAAAASPVGPTIQADDVRNVMVAARMALPQLRGADLVNVAASLTNLDAAFAPRVPPNAAAEAPPAAPAGQKPAAESKG